MNALKKGDSKLVIAGLGALAVFAFFVMGAVFFAILQGLGMNEDLAWGLSVLCGLQWWPLAFWASYATTTPSRTESNR